MKRVRIVAKAVIMDADDRVLILRRSATDPIDPGAWDFPGGRAETGESIFDAVIRETAEETGLKLDEAQVRIGFGRTIFEYDTNKLILLFIVRLSAGQDSTVTLSDEHDEYYWLSPEEVYAQKDKLHHPVWLEGLDYIQAHELL